MKSFIWYSIVILLLISSVVGIILLGVLYNKLNREINMFSQIDINSSIGPNGVDKDIVETNYVSTKISPNAKIVFKTLYKKCGDIKVEEKIADENIVNKNEYEFSEEYKEWEIKKFSSNEVILYKEVDKMCGDDYYIKDLDGTICVIKVDDEGNESLYKKTDIEVQYLPNEDKEKLHTGIKTNKLENINKIIEDFE